MKGSPTSPVSVVIPTHNYGRFIAAALDSVLAQEGVAEVIVADDGSTDETEAVVHRYPNIRYLQLQSCGAAAARNAGWHHSRGEVVCFLDADDWWLPGKVRAQLDLLNLHPEYALAYCDTYRVNEVGRRLARWSKSKPPVSDEVFWQELVLNRIQTSTVAIRRKVLDESDGFDESLTAWEDIDLWLRVTARHPIGYVPEALACYRMHGTGLSRRALDMAAGELRCLEKLGGLLGIQGDSRFREAFANAQIHMGTAHYLLGEMSEARRWLHRGWSSDPRALIRERSAETFGKTLLGPTLTTWLRRIRHGKLTMVTGAASMAAERRSRKGTMGRRVAQGSHAPKPDAPGSPATMRSVKDITQRSMHLPVDATKPAVAVAGTVPGVHHRNPLAVGPCDVDQVAVVVLTRNRADRLQQCLRSVRAEGRFGAVVAVLVCDSSTGSQRKETHAVAASFGARYVHHDSQGAAAARNVCARVAQGEVLISLDDDVCVQPGALETVLTVFREVPGPAVVAGHITFGGGGATQPGVIQPTGYGRSAKERETPDYLVGGFLCYPRTVALRWPWNERLLSSEDIFMGLVWRYQGVAMHWAPNAQATHDDRPTSYGPEHYRYHIYTNLADALYVRRSLLRVVCYELFGLPLALKDAGLRGTAHCLRGWIGGHLDLLRDIPKIHSTWFGTSAQRVATLRRHRNQA